MAVPHFQNPQILEKLVCKLFYSFSGVRIDEHVCIILLWNTNSQFSRFKTKAHELHLRELKKLVLVSHHCITGKVKVFRTGRID